ncbi:MAG: DUF167 domain-containing protein [Armatimonadota bacterium]|nr:DUF167 domain-containing protein [Armatimonadota bacterium]MDR7451770.1 DUF167 domain-containing protein [Armatimonadota bacterium]MDR7467395.1 DUF167 domain-containing protein [Armatimonadota bacterium]MDR7494165.1 DUF167 domain-containing protein [Armatimonadota bacterium]MDR7498869.1 DUF167 domain-containing protein [Armatimonadota bacterium]
MRVSPRAARDRIRGWRQGRLLVETTAPPIEGRANDAVCRLVAAAVGVPPAQVRVVRGFGRRDKTVAVSGLPPDRVLQALRHPAFV